IKWATGGSYIVAGGNEGKSSATVIGCYQESGQPPAQVNAPAIVVGGSMGANGVDGITIAGSTVNGASIAVPSLTCFGANGDLVQVGMQGASRVLHVQRGSGATAQLVVDDTTLRWMINESYGPMTMYMRPHDGGTQNVNFDVGTVQIPKLYPGPN